MSNSSFAIAISDARNMLANIRVAISPHMYDLLEARIDSWQVKAKPRAKVSSAQPQGLFVARAGTIPRPLNPAYFVLTNDELL